MDKHRYAKLSGIIVLGILSGSLLSSLDIPSNLDSSSNKLTEEQERDLIAESTKNLSPETWGSGEQAITQYEGRVSVLEGYGGDAKYYSSLYSLNASENYTTTVKSPSGLITLRGLNTSERLEGVIGIANEQKFSKRLKHSAGDTKLVIRAANGQRYFNAPACDKTNLKVFINNRLAGEVMLNNTDRYEKLQLDVSKFRDLEDKILGGKEIDKVTVINQKLTTCRWFSMAAVDMLYFN